MDQAASSADWLSLEWRLSQRTGLVDLVGTIPAFGGPLWAEISCHLPPSSFWGRPGWKTTGIWDEGEWTTEQQQEAGGNSAMKKGLEALAWYHGSITRIAAELSLARDGDFLVRDCISAPGNYVLTCRWRGQVLNFRMNCVEQEGRLQFQFEEVACPSVEELVLYHWDEQKPISQISGALIRNPIHREGASEQENITQQRTGGEGNGPLMKMASSSTEGSYYFSEHNFVVKHREPDKVLGRQTQSMILETLPNFLVPLPDDSHDRARPLEQGQEPPARYQYCAMSLPRTRSGDILSSASSPERMTSTFSTFKRCPSESNLIPTASTTTGHDRHPATNGGRTNGFPKLTAPFPKDIELPPKDARQMSPSSSDSTIYDVPRQQPPRPCLSEKQIQCNGLYDQPRALKGQQRPYHIPPPPPPRRHLLRQHRGTLSSSGGGGRYGSVLSAEQRSKPHRNGQSHRAKTGSDPPRSPLPVVLGSNGTPSTAVVGERVNALHTQEIVSDCPSLASETDTSYLEHRELTPLLSSDNDSLLLDTSSLPGDPFPPGVPQRVVTPLGGAVPFTTDESSSASSSTSTSCSSSSLSPPSCCSNQPNSQGPLSLVSCEYIMKQHHGRSSHRQRQRHHHHHHHPSSLRTRSMFHSGLPGVRSFLKSDNKPLDPEAIKEVLKILGGGSTAAELALHMTHLDMELLSIRLNHEYAELPDITSGLHLITLVDGQFLRQDAIERALCVRIFVLVSIFTSANWTESVRALAKWIDVAWECFEVLGNHFGFFNIASSLNLPHLRSLSTLWHNLERDHSPQALKFSQHLRPTLRAMNRLEGAFQSPIQASSEGGISVPKPLTTIPHIVPFLSGCKDLKERRSFQALYKEIFASTHEADEGEAGNPLFQSHLAQMNRFLQRIGDFKANGDKIMADFEINEAQLEVLRTEFHLRLFWGSRGCLASPEERHMKFEKVIHALATICQSIEKTLGSKESTQ